MFSARRALGALGLAVSFVTMAAAPALADNNLYITQGSFSHGTAVGSANSYYTTVNHYLSEEVWAQKNTDSGADQTHCTEVWVDFPLDQHHPMDVYTNCRANTYYSGILPVNWPSSDGNPPNGQISVGDVNGSQLRFEVCNVNVTNWLRRDGIECSHTSAGEPGAFQNFDYNAMSLQTIQATYGCGSGCYVSGASLMPQYINHGNIDLLFSGQNLNPGDLLVSWDGTHRFVMQHDGNLVLYNANNVATWALQYGPQGNCFWPGETLVPGSHISFQASDGNLVLISPTGHVIWADATYSNCPPYGSLGGGGQYLKMQNDGNLVDYYNSGVLWSTGTNGH